MVKSSMAVFFGILLLAGSVAGQEWDLGEWAEQLGQQVEPTAGQQATRPTLAAVSPSVPSGKPVESGAVATIRAATPADEPTSMLATESEAPPSEEYLIRFGVGASWLHPMRASDGAQDDRVLSDFSVAWTPFNWPIDLGVDLLIARDQMFLVRPNIKIFGTRGRWFSAYLELGCEMFSLAGGFEVGGGAGLGVVIGLADHLAFELRASASIFAMGEGSDSLVFGGSDVGAPASAARLAVMPTAGGRLVARF